ncbi:unnamed protein product [Ilex paraguariensis]|uniref:RNase III domain-containing protein n=1 Tax=Ilex paraguariensis TaxID=185542 RepID=A0ABC8TA70_9AQUA
MDSSVRAVEKLLGYRFQNKKLLEEALTHSSYIDSESYERLEFFGDAALGLAISKYLFIIYPEIDPGQLTLLHAVNISTERFARVAVRHRLYSYVQRRNVAALDGKVREFTEAVQQEDDTKVYGGDVKAPKVLADIVKSLAAAVYLDCQFNVTTLMMVRVSGDGWENKLDDKEVAAAIASQRSRGSGCSAGRGEDLIICL